MAARNKRAKKHFSGTLEKLQLHHRTQLSLPLNLSIPNFESSSQWTDVSKQGQPLTDLCHPSLLLLHSGVKKIMFFAAPLKMLFELVSFAFASLPFLLLYRSSESRCHSPWVDGNVRVQPLAVDAFSFQLDYIWSLPVKCSSQQNKEVFDLNLSERFIYTDHAFLRARFVEMREM